MNHVMPINCARRAKIYLSLIGIASLGFASVANARVTQIIITNTEARNPIDRRCDGFRSVRIVRRHQSWDCCQKSGPQYW